ncbi:iron ABC transporter ATP-binding protein [Bacillus sp. 7586-K]|nr:iron ABC transporter ATP-binding protein [Bacillus sp. 7586-K]
MEINELTFSYDKKSNQLQDVTVKIKKGKVTTIIGPNGSGKSTLLGVMSRNLLPSEGQVIIEGKAVHEYSAKELARKLAVVHQQNDAPHDLTVEKLISYGRIPYKRLLKHDKQEDQEAIEFAIECTNLQAKRHATLKELSGGERQRVWIAMAIAQKTPIIFLDEPTTYLDIFHQFEVLQLIKRLNEEYKVTIVMVLHDINQAIRYSDYLLVMKNGELMMEGTPENVVTKDGLKGIYGVDCVVKEDDQTGLYIVPIGI